ncbi:MAG: hypothetical protein IPL39_18875 [Opitutaceae bacterium]|nr:hypothetical protein [Opitutaceae bacterium]
MIAAPIADTSAEAQVAGWLLNCDGNPRTGRRPPTSPHHFAGDMLSRDVFAASLKLRREGKHVGMVSVGEVLRGHRTPAEINSISDTAPTSAYFADSVATLREMHHRRQVRAWGLRLVETAETGEGIADVVSGIAGMEEGTGPESLSSRMDGRLFSRAKRPPEAVPRFTLGDVGICTPGNITAISAAVKSGKSSFIGAMLAAVMTPDPEGVDCLGVTARNPDGFALVHLDTEQSIADHWAMIDRALRRANVDQEPEWLRSYCVSGFSLHDVRGTMTRATESARRQFEECSP